MIYLGLVAILLALALASPKSLALALPLLVNAVATIALQEAVSYQPMMFVDALTFLAMAGVVSYQAMRDRFSIWFAAASALMGLSSFAHFAYYGLGENRFAYSLWHMQSLQAFYLASVVAILFGGYDAWQFLASLLDRVRRAFGHASGMGWAYRRADRAP